MRLALLLPCAVTLVACATGVNPDPELMQPGTLETLPARPADYRINYGGEPGQFGELRLPKGSGPHPVAVLIHGGCWKAEYASLRDLAAMADALTEEGIATWNIEYRRIGDAGDGWPGTYLDVAAGIDHLRSLAGPYRLDLSRVVVVGHSAGGHLAHWTGARSRISSGSAIYSPDPLPVRGIINMAGRIDMAEAISPHETLCRDQVVHKLMGGDPQTVPQRYRDASPIKHLPLGVPQILIWGDHEEFVPAPLVESYAAAAKQAGDDIELIVVQNTGHFETASPKSTAWPTVLRAVQRLLGNSKINSRQ